MKNSFLQSAFIISFLVFSSFVLAKDGLVTKKFESPKNNGKVNNFGKDFDVQSFMKRRQELFDRLMKMALEGDSDIDEINKELQSFQDDEGLFPKDLWNDDVFSDLESKMNGDLGNFRSWSKSSGADYEWKENKNERILEITPKDKQTPLDIQIKNGQIQISGKVKEENIQKNSHTMKMSSFSQSFSAPDDVDAEKASIDHKDGKVLIHFPLKDRSFKNSKNSSAKSGDYKKTLKQNHKKESGTPLKVLPGDVTI